MCELDSRTKNYARGFEVSSDGDGVSDVQVLTREDPDTSSSTQQLLGNQASTADSCDSISIFPNSFTTLISPSKP